VPTAAGAIVEEGNAREMLPEVIAKISEAKK